MSPVREEAIRIISSMPEDKLYYFLKVLEELEAQDIPQKNNSLLAFEKLQQTEIEVPEDFDGQKELDEWRNEKAENVHADYIITRNTKDFTYSKVPCLTPEEFLKVSGIVTV